MIDQYEIHYSKEPFNSYFVEKNISISDLKSTIYEVTDYVRNSWGLELATRIIHNDKYIRVTKISDGALNGMSSFSVNINK